MNNWYHFASSQETFAIWIGYIGSRDQVEAKRILSSQIKDGKPNHFTLFGSVLGQDPFRYVESEEAVYWWVNPTAEARFRVEDFFDRKGLRVSAHYAIALGKNFDEQDYTHHGGLIENTKKRIGWGRHH